MNHGFLSVPCTFAGSVSQRLVGARGCAVCLVVNDYMVFAKQE